MTLGIKLGRRLVAAAAVDGEAIVFHDSRYAPRPPQVASGFSRYVSQLLEQVKPTLILCYAPGADEGLTRQLLSIVESEAAARGIPCRRSSRADVFGAFGVVPLRTRHQLKELLLSVWPALASGKSGRQAALAEAAATALVGDIQRQWPPV